jgi:hypothetical protein
MCIYEYIYGQIKKRNINTESYTDRQTDWRETKRATQMDKALKR